ncbi:catechol 2,3-dioxygenase [Nitrospirillum amazonense]|uniref:Catechol 2,3-dioxygenase n=1 Tax=Nitrospirillum amazonense TaxID=28077 RepID=A0A560JMM8_9PROT|nr:VOC family protein [Nitrospirillum amazonense]TWB70714.1 catechol 2,3-dioxygenase [Nitrospirillum amazonense]
MTPSPYIASPHVAGLRSVALTVPDVGVAEDFYTRVWHLDVVARTHDAVYLRGTAAAHHLLSLHAGPVTQIRNVTFQVRSLPALDTLARTVVEAGGRILAPVGPVTEPGGGMGLTVADPDGRILRFVHGDAEHADAGEVPDRPIRLTHVVLNSRDVARTQAFFEQALGFKLSDRTRIMAFLRCGPDHHSVALGDADTDSLNHIAFLMPDLESVMRGGGRMRDAGYAIEWGPGRHGPGNNGFNYFIGPFGVVIEYTAEVQQVDDSYPTGAPENWTWPPGRVDQWGISHPPSPALKQAQRAVFFAPAG